MFGNFVIILGVALSTFHYSAGEVNRTSVIKMQQACQVDDLPPELKTFCGSNLELHNKLTEFNERPDLTSQDRKELTTELLAKSDRDNNAYSRVLATLKHYKLRELQVGNRKTNDARVQETITNEVLMTGSGNVSVSILLSNTTLSNATYQQCTNEKEHGIIDNSGWFSNDKTEYLKKNNTICKVIFDERQYSTDVSNGVVNTGSGHADIKIQRVRRSVSNDVLNIGNGSVSSIVDFPESNYKSFRMIRTNYIFQHRNFSDLKDPDLVKFIVDPKVHNHMDKVFKHRVTVFINKDMEMFSRIDGHRYTIVRNICEACAERCMDVFSEFFNHVRVDCDQHRNGTENAISVPLKNSTIIMNPITYCKFFEPKPFYWLVPPKKPVFECNTLDCNYMVNDEPRVC